MMTTTKTTVTTYQSPNGGEISVCAACKAHIEETGDWPRDAAGGEYCTVSHVAHYGHCDICDPCDD